MSARSVVALAIAVLGTWAVAGAADALESGVFVDPGSPAGKEYGVPLSVLRGAASGRPDDGASAPPLFGIGISHAGASPHVGGAVKHGKGSRATRGKGSPATRAQPIRRKAPGGAAQESTALANLTRHGSAVPAVGLLGALVVFGGLGFGALLFAARRRLR